MTAEIIFIYVKILFPNSKARWEVDNEQFKFQKLVGSWICKEAPTSRADGNSAWRALWKLNIGGRSKCKIKKKHNNSQILQVVIKILKFF